MPKTVDFFMVAGEVSGDFLGASILHSLFQKKEDLVVMGIGGACMRAYPFTLTQRMEELQVMGFIDVVAHLPRLLTILNATTKTILALNPKAVVTIDYPGFNLRLAKRLRKQGYQGKICHVVCPSVWAWGKQRIKTLARYDDLLLSLFPFEKKLFRRTSLSVEYVGHPLVSKIRYEEKPEDNLIALFPGSRTEEIKKNLPFFLRTVAKLGHFHRDLEFIVSLSQEKYRPLLEKMIGISPISILSPQEMAQRRPYFALAKCGTIAFELALQGIPTIVTYAMSSLDIALAKWLFRVDAPYYSLPNLILQKPLFPELIGPDLTDEALFEIVCDYLTHPEEIQRTRLECQEMRASLQAPEEPAHRAAILLLNLISSETSRK